MERSIRLLRSKYWKDFDWVLLAAALLLSTISLIEIYSSTMAQPSGNFFLRQLAWVSVGIVLLFVVAAIDYHLISEQIPWLYILAIGALIYNALAGIIGGVKFELEGVQQEYAAPPPPHQWAPNQYSAQ